MTDHDDLHRRSEEFVQRFWALVRETCLGLSQDDIDLLLPRLQDSTSVYHPGVFPEENES